MADPSRPRDEQVRDVIMVLILAIWLTYAGAAVIQLFTTGARVLESLPPFWFWGIPLAPYTALYVTPPWNRPAPADGQQPAPPPPPAPPAAS